MTVDPKMPDPWGPPSIVDLNVYEISIREVLSRVDALTAQLGEYAAVAIRDGGTSTEDARTQKAIDVLSGAAMEALQAWDRWLTVQNAEEREPAPSAEQAIDSILGRIQAKAATARQSRPTPDQEEAAARHLRLQKGKPE